MSLYTGLARLREIGTPAEWGADTIGAFVLMVVAAVFGPILLLALQTLLGG